MGFPRQSEQNPRGVLGRGRQTDRIVPCSGQILTLGLWTEPGTSDRSSRPPGYGPYELGAFPKVAARAGHAALGWDVRPSSSQVPS